MEKLKDIENKIISLRTQMHKLLHKNDFITTKEIVKISQELDEVLNLYHKIKNKIN
ncbi:aspartyl-phosphate phosphatase Spo0E family protein [Senegalia massiliensis]|uniref:Aspartyl-phosphate phosphatase Spo0E family protein n=1 Tax=Senegalia massiliensis TaxID=1720316 RepID=A0A845QVZ1_9CLOT|nr:aspartyl-phosphate phosphatase Spo0E family protein [Senegalia massiliensis]NBI06685.1 aspartyl-phosphate phosphatase Spo0E family protein [Senegalia massiliensis]